MAESIKTGLIALLSVFFLACEQNKSPLLALEHNTDPVIEKVMNQPDLYELQMQLQLPEALIRNAGDTVSHFSLDFSQEQYFYPASTIKLPVAVLAAEWIDNQAELNVITPYRIEGDTTSHSVAQDLIEIFTISDNQAYNRLYDMLGRDYINRRMAELDFVPFRLAHRLSVNGASDPEHPEFTFETDKGIKSHRAPKDRPIESLDLPGIEKGKGFIEQGRLVNSPMNFSQKNHLPLSTLMAFMRALYPMDCEICPKTFQWNDNTQALVKTLMSTVPRKQGYVESDYPDGYVKFFFIGDGHQRLEDNLRMHNKVGYAYGTLTDVALIIDTKNKIHYLLGASLLVNKNQIFNDNVYEYDDIGLPFLAKASRAIHEILVEQYGNPSD